MKFSFLTVHRLTGFWKKKKEESIAVVQCPSTLIRPNFNLLSKIFARKMMRLSTGAKWYKTVVLKFTLTTDHDKTIKRKRIKYAFIGCPWFVLKWIKRGEILSQRSRSNFWENKNPPNANSFNFVYNRLRDLKTIRCKVNIIMNKETQRFYAFRAIWEEIYFGKFIVHLHIFLQTSNNFSTSKTCPTTKTCTQISKNKSCLSIWQANGKKILENDEKRARWLIRVDAINSNKVESTLTDNLGKTVR